MVMARTAGQVPAHTDLAFEVAVQVPVSRVKVTKAVSISNLVKGTSSSSLVIRVIRSNSTVVSIMCSPRVYANGARRFVKGQ